MIQFISHKTKRLDYLEGIEKALEGGCRWVQLRMKEALPDDIIRTGKQARKLCDKYSATLIIDDHVELVKEIGADGVHLGKNDTRQRLHHRRHRQHLRRRKKPL